MLRLPKRNIAIDKLKDKLQNIYILNTTISLYIFLAILYKKIINFDIDQRAAAVSFSFMLAIFPGTLFLFTLIPYIPIQQLDVLILDFLKNLMPMGLYDAVSGTIVEIVSRPRGDILSFGFLFALFAATNGMMSLMRAFNMALKQREKRSYFKARWIAFILTALLVFVLLLAIIILIVGKLSLEFMISKGLVEENFNVTGINLLGYISIFLIFFLGISSIYYFAPAIKKRLNFFNFGAVFASILCILATNLFSYYLQNFNSYNRLYGSIGTLIAAMVWLYLISLILILGFEVNISLRGAMKRSIKKTPQQSGASGV
ncbi:MAG: YihY/virulence factor BrkB family protein [Cytophagaceae bacterium]|nr:YihY/virulence factor BrkB family protein [Cytophagaceae bacterium]MBK9508360.1 YihY/virulence factor BrkB family protein [Cytophagaceae bacterium]MBK9934054.1 YihY/virulence factor BrkB family protein [Cytophagaceae bacterium]MBL0300511.1 YihY/virulence factor BrkB family protein [Cytophagaceae bacterium]MBL0327445.1 YihY/virulence factor BrkB family protein [Cytophagaceae bacterium]